MKLVLDEKLKHRLVGISVVLSLAAIFLPAMFKKSSQRLENNLSVRVQLPPKPTAPNVVMTDEDQMFKTIKVAELDATPEHITKEIATPTDLDSNDFVASAPIEDDVIAPVAKLDAQPLKVATHEAVKTVVKKKPTAAPKLVKPVARAVVKAAPVKAKAKPAIKKTIYAVQLASFAKVSNAQALVKKLQQKGYKANYLRMATRNGVVYKVFAGHSPVKSTVEHTQLNLATALQLNGFIVNTGVS